MKTRRVRAKNIRLLWTESTGREGLLDFASVTEAREARDALPADCTDWVIFEIEHPLYAAAGRNIESRA